MDTNIQKFQAFVKTVDLGSFTKAAEALSCSQSGISRMIGDDPALLEGIRGKFDTLRMKADD